MSADAPDRILAGLHLMDRQLVDCEGWLAGKVDDLELEVRVGGDGPVVVAILSGPGALAGRIGGRLGAWLGALHRRLHEEKEPGPARIPIEHVARIHDVVELDQPRRSLASNASEEWARNVVVGKIPGARHAPE
jgi:hypothetical protein